MIVAERRRICNACPHALLRGGWRWWRCTYDADVHPALTTGYLQAGECPGGFWAGGLPANNPPSTAESADAEQPCAHATLQAVKPCAGHYWKCAIHEIVQRGRKCVPGKCSDWTATGRPE